MAEGCAQDESTGLSVCEAPATASLHALLRTVSEYLEANGSEYEYRLDYLPTYVSGNDVAALSRYVLELQKRNLPIPTALVPFTPAGPRDPVTSADVEAAAAQTAAIIAAINESFEAVKAADGRSEITHQIITLGIVGVVSFGVGFGVGKMVVEQVKKRKTHG